MPTQSRRMLPSSSSSRPTQRRANAVAGGGSPSRVRRSHARGQPNRRPQRGLGVAKLEELRMLLELEKSKSASSTSLVPVRNDSLTPSPFQNSQPSHAILNCPPLLRNLVEDFNRRPNSPSEYLQNFGRNNNSSLQPQLFIMSLNNLMTAPPALPPAMRQRTPSSRRRTPDLSTLQRSPSILSRTFIDPDLVLSGMVAPNRAQMDPFGGYVGVGTVVQTSSSLSSLMHSHGIQFQNQRTSQERSVLNVVSNSNYSAYDSFTLGAGSYGQNANNNLGGSVVMAHTGLVAAQQDGVQARNGYKRNEIVFGYEFIPGEGGRGIGLFSEPPLKWNYGDAAPSVVSDDPPAMVSSITTSNNSSVTTFHYSEETTSVAAADAIDLALRLSI